MVSGPHASLHLPRKFSSAITATTALAAGAGSAVLSTGHHGSYAHWEAWIEFYTDANGTTIDLPTTSDFDVTVSPIPASVSGYDEYFEAITNGDITTAGGAFTAGPRVNWSGRTGAVKFTWGGACVLPEGLDYYRLIAWGYHS